jgi:hypothetical protein
MGQNETYFHQAHNALLCLQLPRFFPVKLSKSILVNHFWHKYALFKILSSISNKKTYRNLVNESGNFIGTRTRPEQVEQKSKFVWYVCGAL